MAFRLRALAALLPLLPLLACTAPAPSAPRVDVAAARQADVDALVRLVETHPAPFESVPEAAWRRDVEALRGRAGQLTEDEFLVAVARLANLGARNGHGGVFPTDQRHPMWALRLYEFADGWHVVAAADQSLVGGRLVAVGGRPVAEVTTALRPVVPYDNVQTVRARLAMYLAAPAFLRGSGVYGDGTVTLSFPGGGRRVVTPTDVPPAEWAALAEVDVPQIPPALPRPSYAADDWFWSARRGRALVLGYERVTEESLSGRRTGWLAEEVSSALASADPPSVLVVDLRRNPGGEIAAAKPVTILLRDVARAGRVPVRVLIGRGTYSAASLAFAELRSQVRLRFYGEETSGGLGTYSNPGSETLASSGIVVQVARSYVTGDGRDVPTIKPDVPVAVTWADHASSRDPALAAASRL